MGVEMRDDALVSIGEGQIVRRSIGENSRSSLKLLKVTAERVALDGGRTGSVLADLAALAVEAFGIGAAPRRIIAGAAN